MAEKTFVNKDGKQIQRTRCLVYTRVMWYLSPTYRYNVGKKSEFYSRKYFSKQKAANHDFVMQYGSGCGNMEFNADTNLIKGAAKNPAMATVTNGGGCCGDDTCEV